MPRKAMLWEKLGKKRVHCRLCAHRCKINEGDFGICGMRENVGGELRTFAYGKVIARHVDPIEKKPFYHFLPGSYAFSIATIGCNFRCSFCQNWTISQASARAEVIEGEDMTPEAIVDAAIKSKCKSVSYTYTEPTIFFEYAYDTSRIARKKGLRNNFVTNGFMTKEAIDKIAPYLDAANIDLKFFNDKSYGRLCMGRLQPVIDSIRYMKKKGIWVEVTTLIVTGENDSEEEVRDIAKFLAGVDKDMPWHISRFHPDYKYLESEPTAIDVLKKAYEIGREEGLKYVYLGNVPAENDTICPGCGGVFVKRSVFEAEPAENFQESGKCKKCGAGIAGVWK